MKVVRHTGKGSESVAVCDCEACAVLPFARWQRNAMSRYRASQPSPAMTPPLRRGRLSLHSNRSSSE